MAGKKDNAVVAVISGLTLGSSAPEIYRSLAEAAVMGAKRIVGHFQENSVNITISMIILIKIT